jgi:hypothetical protein
MPIVEPTDESDRRREQRIALARKAIWLRERSARTDANGRISAADNRAAMIAAGIEPPPTQPDPEVAARIARLEAAVEHRLTTEEVDSLTGTTAEEIAAEVDALRPPGDGGARGIMPRSGGPFDEQIREAELAGDISAAMSLKTQKLQQISEDRAAANHPNAPR